MAYNQQLSVFSQYSANTTGTAGQVYVSGGNSAPSYWASAIPVSAYSGQFNGSSYLSIPNNAAFNLASNDFTIEGWWYFTDLSNQALISKYSSPGGGWAVQWYSTNNLRLVLNTSGTDSVYQFAWTPTINTWYHVAITRSGTNGRAFINGTQIGSTTTVITAHGDSSGTLQVGLTHTVSEYTRGYASNIRIVKGVAVYTGNFTVPTSPLGTSQAAGTNIAAITPSQVSLLTCNNTGFTDSSPNAFNITNNGTVVSSQFAPFTSFSAIARSATQTQTILTSGSGTYYTPSGVAWLRVRMVGGGGGGAGAGYAGNYGSAGGAGANTTFGTSLLNAGGGTGAYANGAIGTGGTSSIGSGATGIALTGGGGGGWNTTAKQYTNLTGGIGAASAFGGAGIGNISAAGGAAATNTGGGGGGGGTNTLGDGTQAYPGGGGGSGGYVEGYISNPAASYAYTVGAGGAGGASSYGYAGGAGGSGVIIVEENYAVNVTTGNYTAQYLIVAGGGGGGSGRGGGGGAGGLLSGIITLIPSTVYSFTVGAGGGANTNGSNSAAFGFTAIGGGTGGGEAGYAPSLNGAGGGSGGGGAADTGTGGSGTSGQGFTGGSALIGLPSYLAGGGGGAGAAGANATSSNGGNGGAGVASSITGTSVTYAGGGGGSGNGGTPGSGGSGGGGAGTVTAGATGGAGTINTGGGGGGGAGTATRGAGGSGGSGVVILSIPNFNYTGITTGSPTVTISGSNRILTFTSSGTYTA